MELNIKYPVVTIAFHFCKDCINDRWGYPVLSTSLKDDDPDNPLCCAYCGTKQYSGFKPGTTRDVRVRYKGRGHFNHFWRIVRYSSD